VSTWLDSTALAVALYTLAGALALVLGVVERRRGRADPSLWPTFWFLTGGFLLIMAVGRASAGSDLLTGYGREQAWSEGWYDTRRSLQAWVIAAVAAVWAVTVAVVVAVVVWRARERGRRYFPAAIVVFTLVCFIGVRLISLHQVDALLNDRYVRGVTIGAVIEIGLLLTFVVVSAWRFRRPSSVRRDEQPGVDVETGPGPHVRP
jgi:hypothetical protein